MNEWLRMGKSRYGIKDSKEFTSLLERHLAQQDNTPFIPSVPVQDSAQGSILRVTWKEDGHVVWVHQCRPLQRQRLF